MRERESASCSAVGHLVYQHAVNSRKNLGMRDLVLHHTCGHGILQINVLFQNLSPFCAVVSSVLEVTAFVGDLAIQLPEITASVSWDLSSLMSFASS